ncbi:MAG TPA: ATP-binding protein [Thermoanaerobaculia bacterium]|jgi:PAS domain S-box-containing protein|nr:ATP-binding protein [Thermoanaerobaculia bacterium]
MNDDSELIASLRESQALLAASQRMAKVGSWVLDLLDTSDLHRNALRWSDETYRIFGYEPRSVEVSNDLFFSHVHPDDRLRLQETVAAALRDDIPYEIENRIVLRDGTEKVIYQWAEIERDSEGRPWRLLGSCQDITERRRAEEALRASEEALKESDRRKDEFLATLAHELRNPLNPIRSAVEVLRLRGPDSPDLRWGREVIDRQVDHLTRLIDDLLDVSRITRNKLELRKQQVDLAEILNGAVESNRPLIDRKGQELAVTLPAEPVFLEADLVRLTQAFINLLDNAAKYTPAGGRIALSAERQGAEVVVSVKDTGIGIPPGKLAHLFDMFYQVDRSLERSHGGLGIGLTLVKRLVEMHGGTVEARSQGPDLGSEFMVRLPVVAAEPASAREREAAVEGARTAARRILVVDDNRDSAESLALLLQVTGNEVRTAFDGLEAVEEAERFRPDVVLLDIGMPKLNGYEAARRIRGEPWGKGMLLIAQTGWGQEEDRRRSQEAGFDAHLTKPVDHLKLIKLLTGS